MRYYYSGLSAPQRGRVRIERPGGQREYYRFAASAHYEVEHANPHHADVEECPICGRTGPEYGQVKGNLVEQVHDPLGVELLLAGTIRRQRVHHEDWERRPFGSVQALSPHFRVSTATYDGQTDDRNTRSIGVVFLERR